jgi:hypothetical protein
MLIEAAQVLDSGASRGDAWARRKESNIMDPAAIGNTLIGLEAVRREQSYNHPAARRPQLRRPSRLRAALAASLRALADAVDARPREQAHGT